MRILAPVDGSLSSRMIVRFLGTRSTLLGKNPEIELLNVQYTIPEGIVQRFGMEAVEEVYQEEGQKIFEQMKSDIEAAHLDPEYKVSYGEFGKAIAREAEAWRADLIIMGTRGLSPMKSLFLGSVSRAVLQYAKTPLLLIRDKLPALKDSLRVALAADGSDYGDAAAAFVADSPELFGEKPEIAVINVVPDVSELAARGAIESVSPVDDVKIFNEERDKAFAAATNPVVDALTLAGLDAKAVRLVGDPAEEIAKWAAENADIVVMGSHGYGKFKSAVLGSTAVRVGAETDLPLLVVRSPSDAD